MGEQTVQFASRFATAVDLLARVATNEGYAKLHRRLGPELDAAVSDALDAVAALHETGTDAVRNWSEQRARVLALVSEVRADLARGGVDAAVRRGARALVELVGERGIPDRE